MTVGIEIDRRPGEIKAVASREGRLVDVALVRPGSPDRWGDLLEGVVRTRDVRTGGVFVSLETGEVGFLPDREAGRLSEVGARIRVRVIRAAIGEKGLRLSTRLSDAELALPSSGDGLVRAGPDALSDMLARYPDAVVRLGDAGLAARLRERLGRREVVIGAGCSPEMLEAVAALDEMRLALPGGASATVVPTPALTAIDVDLGTDGSVRGARQTALFAANRLLLGALADEIRLRNLGGAILIDLAGLSARKRQALDGDVHAAFERDPAARFLGFSRLGLAEIVRSATRPPWHALRAGPMARALDAAEALVGAVRARPGVRLGLALAPDLDAAMARDRVLRADLEEELGRPGLRCRVVPGLAPEGWSVEEAT